MRNVCRLRRPAKLRVLSLTILWPTAIFRAHLGGKLDGIPVAHEQLVVTLDADLSHDQMNDVASAIRRLPHVAGAERSPAVKSAPALARLVFVAIDSRHFDTVSDAVIRLPYVWMIARAVTHRAALADLPSEFLSP